MTDMPQDFQGRRAFVTGAAGGIGSAISRLLTQRGATVARCDAREGPNVRITFDVRDRAAIERAFDLAEQQLGGVCDLLVNAAGIYPSDTLLEMTEDAWDRVLDTNAKSVFLVSQEFCRRLVARVQPGSIVNISSSAADRARRGAAHYSASKAAVELLTRSFALEFAEHRIRVNAVSPGFVEVNSEVNPLSDAYVEAITRTIPLGRPGSPEDIARVAVFLSSNQAEWVTGTSFRVDGGSQAGTLALPVSASV